MEPKSFNLTIVDDLVSPQLFQNRIVCEYLSSAQAAQYLGITENALRIMVHRRQIKFTKLGRRLRFHVNDLIVLLPQRGG